MANMKAVTRVRYGSQDVLSVTTRQKPEPSATDLLVKVCATTVNRTDCALLLGKPWVMRLIAGFSRPRKEIPGTDFSGIVEAIGKNVTGFRPGDLVFGFDDSGICSQAEYMTIDAGKAIVKMPPDFSFRQAAASAEGAHYAYNFLNKVKLNAHDQVLVNGATGAIGSAAVQLLKDSGVSITAVCREEHAEIVKKLGAHRVIDYTTEDFTKLPWKYHFIFDTVGKSSFFRCKKLLLEKGIYISSELGPWSQNLFLSLFTPLMGGKRVKFPLPLHPRKSLEFITKLAERKAFDPLIDRAYSLDDVQDAYGYVLSGKKAGNVILSIQEDH